LELQVWILGLGDDCKVWLRTTGIRIDVARWSEVHGNLSSVRSIWVIWAVKNLLHCLKAKCRKKILKFKYGNEKKITISCLLWHLRSLRWRSHSTWKWPQCSIRLRSMHCTPRTLSSFIVHVLWSHRDMFQEMCGLSEVKSHKT